MSAAEESLKPKEAFKPKTAPVLNRILDFLSSVRFGVVLLCVLVVLAMVGMIILQQNVSGFDAYYVSLTPAEKTIFGGLGLFDIYHTYYFNALLLILSLNIVLASIDRFGSSWSYIAKPKKTATKPWLLARKSNAQFEMAATSDTEAVRRIEEAIKANGLKTSVVENASGTYVFGEAGQYNRIGAYIVHVFLLTLFLGHFVALQTGFDADVRMTPGEKTDSIQMIQYNLDRKDKFNVKLPFSMECTDISQTLIDPTGNIDVSNTLDWATKIRIDDPAYGVIDENISLNKPLNYRGYRFFQAQTIPVGNARTIKLDLTPSTGGDVVELKLDRGGSATMPDGTKVDFEQFMPDFTMGKGGQPDTKSGEYLNPVAVLGVTPPQGAKVRIYAFAQKLPDNAPVAAPKLGYKWHLSEYEKSPLAHVLSIKYDPFDAAFVAWYIGGFGLIGALCFVFFYSHRRVWALATKQSDGRYDVVMAGEANRNQFSFQDKFDRIVRLLHGVK